ncbi:MAG: restriction endonuclease subunit S, partial [Rhodococcus sp.]|nr:restriction endonuclease subunit S [Rhodococcus sp. (in: high G+C Gram-positive bacteria)]
MSTAHIGHFVESVKKWNPRRDGAGIFTYVDISSVDSVAKAVTQSTTVAASEAPSRARQLIATGDVLVSTVRPNLNAVAYVDPNLDGATASTGFCVLRPRPDELDRRYLFHWVQTRQFIGHLVQLATGASYPAVSDKIVKAAPIPLPPINEQKRIAVALDAADELRAKRRAALAKLDTLTQAIYIDMFGEATDWPTGRLGDHVPTTSGGTPSRSRPDLFDGRIPWVKSGELALGIVTTSEERITDEALAGSSAKLMPVGTVLLAMYGATVGEVAVLGIEAATNQAVCCISPTESVTGPYLVGLLRARKRDLIRRAAGGAQPNISQTIIRELEIPLPPSAI